MSNGVSSWLLITNYYHSKFRKTQKYQNPKGDGSFWYAEATNNDKDYIYHSTSACPNIRNGINVNWGSTNPTYRKQHSQFCSKCMDSNLIRMCQAYLYTDKNWK